MHKKSIFCNMKDNCMGKNVNFALYNQNFVQFLIFFEKTVDKVLACKYNKQVTYMAA